MVSSRASSHGSSVASARGFANELAVLRVNVLWLCDALCYPSHMVQGVRVRACEPSAPVSLGLLDLLADVEATLQEVAAGVGLYGSWRRLLKVLPSKARELAARRDAERLLGLLTVLNERVSVRVKPRKGRRMVGLCPSCGRPLHATGEEVAYCSRCLKSVRQVAARLEALERLHVLRVTMTPAELSRWLHNVLSLQVSRKLVSAWVARGRVHALNAGSGRYTFNVHEIARLAQRHAE